MSAPMMWMIQSPAVFGLPKLNTRHLSTGSRGGRVRQCLGIGEGWVREQFQNGNFSIEVSGETQSTEFKLTSNEQK